jgi:uroporphyrin-III C-methyltransferase
MELSLDLTGYPVLIVGSASGSRRAVAKYGAAGAVVERLDDAELDARLSAGSAVLGLVVWLEGDPSVRRRLTTRGDGARTLVAEEAPASPTPRGLVTLVGGGPGAWDLLTVAGRRALAEADVVLYDRLGPHELLEEAAPGAELIDVGKTPGHHAVPQREIEALLIERALRGLRVVRLKGGDPFVFGRGGEEVLACRAAGVPITVVPGVTSAVSVPAAVGIPVTHREVSRAFTVVSGHAPLSEDELQHLVGLGGTLVVLMGVTNLPHLAAGLQRHGMRADMPLAIVERGYTASQRTTTLTVGEVPELLATLRPSSPAVIVVGEVVRVADVADAADAPDAGVARWRDAAGLIP